MLIVSLVLITVFVFHQATRSYAAPARYSSVTSQLLTTRSQFALYAIQHDDQYPTLNQLQHGWAPLIVETHGAGGEVCGPYLAKVPVNPFTNSSTVAAPGQATARDGWEYDETTGDLRYVLPTKGKFDELGADPEYAVIAITH